MAVVGRQVVVGTQPTRLNSTSSGAGDPIIGSSLVVRTPAVAFLGGAGVTAAGEGVGFELLAGESIALDLGRGEDLYGVVAAGTATVDVLEAGV
jgi:hypothetical protein